LGDNVIYNPFIQKSFAYYEPTVNKIMYSQKRKRVYSKNGSKVATKVPFSNSIDFRESNRNTPLGSDYKTSGKIEISDLCNAQNCNYRIDYRSPRPKWKFEPDSSLDMFSSKVGLASQDVDVVSHNNTSQGVGAFQSENDHYSFNFKQGPKKF